MPRVMAVLFAAVVLSAPGCGGSGGVYSSGEHSHERDRMLLADAGPYHAGLTAHLSSKTGNELDVFFETADKDHKPVPLPLASFTATAKTSDGGEQVLEFKPARRTSGRPTPRGSARTSSPPPPG